MTNKATKDSGTVTVDLAGHYNEAVATLSGADPDKDVVFHIDSGSGVQDVTATTDSSGKATATFIPSSHVTYRIWVTSPVHVDPIADVVEVAS